MSLERKEATADVLHEQGPRPREERVAQDDREQADGGGSPPPPRGARPEEGQRREASDGEGQGGSRPQVGRTRLKKEEAKRPRVRTRGLSTAKLVAKVSGFRPGANPSDVEAATKFALRSVARRHQRLSEEICELDEQLDRLVAEAAPELVALEGVGTDTAASLLIAAG